jgi:cellulose synthase/poly-beta-1,6-N-acetylglucosamine synthase-like glycosyltransferase
MPLFSLPDWLLPHLYPNKSYRDLTALEKSDLRTRLSNFKPEHPEITVVIPAWNEEDNIFRSLSSLAASNTKLRVELIVINNNSSDGTQKVLDELGVSSFFEKEQGISFARQLGLNKAKGTFHLCADSDTFYPPCWIDLMINPLRSDQGIVGVYGRYSFVPPEKDGRFLFSIYEAIVGILIRLRKKRREYINVLGFNMGFITEIGRNNGGFKVKQVRKFDNAMESPDFVAESEDGRMALNLKKVGRLKLITHPDARVFTSSRRLTAEGGLLQSFKHRLFLHSSRMKEYLAGPSADNF